MPRLTKKFCEEMDFFIKSGKRKIVKYNAKCMNCACNCKQSYKATITFCPYYTPRKREAK